MIVLGIETSCDDTGVAIIKISNSKLKILSNIVSSQAKIHAKYGGVFPTLAKREHQKNLPIVFKEAIKKAKNPKIDLIAITVGPGLEMCLWQGVNFAKEVSKNLNLKIVPVNHIEAHIFSSFLNSFQLLKSNIFPAISLVVSGGHTQLIFVKKIGNYKLIGETRDDAAGECFDKVARLLGLSYPGGPQIEKLSKIKLSSFNFKIKLPRPMINQKNFDFSFAGLKTAVLYDFLERPKKVQKSKIYKIEMAKEVQQAVIDVLIEKTKRAKREFGAKSIILGGGVVANDELRKQIKREFKDVKVFLPKKEFCTDNGAMVALVGYLRKEKAIKDFEKIKANANLKI